MRLRGLLAVAVSLSSVTAVGCKTPTPKNDAASGVGEPASSEPASSEPASSETASSETASSETASSESADSDGLEASAGTTPPRLGEDMKRHFAEVSTIKDAVIDGDLDAVAEPARWLSKELPVEGLPSSWRPHLERMQAAAQAAAEADDLIAAGAAAGRLVATCGACHAAVGDGPKFGIPASVPEGDTTTARMQRHQWAADRMWEGMVGRADDRWTAGAAAVSEKPPTPCPIPNAHVLPPEALGLRDKIHQIGAKAENATDWDARANVYGEYLTTCAGCHVGGC